MVSGEVLPLAWIPPGIIVPGGARSADAFHILVDLLRHYEVSLVSPVSRCLVGAPFVGPPPGETAAAGSPVSLLAGFLYHEKGHVIVIQVCAWSRCVKGAAPG